MGFGQCPGEVWCVIQPRSLTLLDASVGQEALGRVTHGCSEPAGDQRFYGAGDVSISCETWKFCRQTLRPLNHNLTLQPSNSWAGATKSNVALHSPVRPAWFHAKLAKEFGVLVTFAF